MMANFFVKALMFAAIFTKVLALPLSDFFQYGGEGDTAIIDRENNIQLLSIDDGVLQIITPHIPFFDRINNTNVQISTNGYIAFGKSIYNVYTSREFPLNGVAMIAPFWNDLMFIETSGKFYYQVHKTGPALEKASREILQRRGIAIQPHFVLVVTWFKTNIYRNSRAKVTFQLALACDATETYAFFLYNQLDYLSRTTSVGWNDGNITESNFFRHPLHRMANVSKLVDTSNVGLDGMWMYRMGEPGGNFPRIHRYPVVKVTTQDNRLVFNCTLGDDVLDPRGVYEITWYNGNTKINKTDILSDGTKTSLLMNENVFQSLYQLGAEISCKVRTWYSNTSYTKSRFFESNKFFAGIKVEPRQFVLTESSDAAKVNVTSTIPIMCADGSANCELTISFSYQGLEVFLSTCMVTFKPNLPTLQELLIFPTQDFVDDGEVNVTITPVVNRPTNMFDWLNHAPSLPIKITTTSVTTASCSSSGDPYISTFDSRWYFFYNIGDFVLAQSGKNNFKIHIRTFDCLQGVTCNCAVAAQEKDDIVAIDMCNSAAPKFRFPTGHPPSPGTSLKEINPSRFQIEFPSGTTITFQVHRRLHRPSFANVYVQISSIYYQNTVGLCGRFDGNRNNDMTSKEGTVYQQTYPASPVFVNSWKLRNKASLFFQKSGRKTCDPPTQLKQTDVCICHTRANVVASICAVGRFALKPTFSSATTFKTIVSAAFSDCNRRRRRRRRAISNTIIIPDEGDDTIYEYDPPDRSFVPSTWPTSSGKTQAQVESFCNNSILNSTSGKGCSVTLGADFDIATFRQECVSDIQISDSYDYIQSIIDSMTSSCTETVLKGVSKYWVRNNNGTLTPPAAFADSICPNDCSGKGQCRNSTCSCNDGFEGEDCSIETNTPPTVVPSVELCDGRNKSCLTVSVMGSNIRTSNPVFCKFTPKSPGSTSITNGAVVVSFAEVLCTLPSPPLILVGDPSNTIGKSTNAFYVQLSNDGTQFSRNKKAFVIYDPKCIQCNSTSAACEVKRSMCRINGYCLAEGESNPSRSVEECVPSIDQYNFSVRQDSCQWSDWSGWTRCSTTCAQGHMRRSRTSINQSCDGLSQESRACLLPPCPDNCHWSGWSAWTDCSTTCAHGYKRRTRTAMIQSCNGLVFNTKTCFLGPCPETGVMSSWTSWTTCQGTCGEGYRSKKRICSNKNCQGNLTDIETCNDGCRLSDCPSLVNDFDCNFETPCWVSDQTGHWVVSTHTPSPSTGPDVDHTFPSGCGHFIYYEASGKPTGHVAYLTSSSFVPMQTKYCFSFYVSMYTRFLQYMGSLHVYMVNSATLQQTLLWENIGVLTNNASHWENVNIDVDVAVGGANMSFLFKAVRGNGYNSDIAIDDGTLVAGQC
ncbi:uncharacterized protein LOC130638810 isoform X2 [Hydractinia symbiolongicarpus]|nr:uncharacterized protein LOC130638810 isoform X2 [Hydractinia symbiolongicarpus]